MSSTEYSYDEFPWDEIDPERDAVGADFRNSTVYVHWGFKVDTNNYTRSVVHIPQPLFRAIWDEAVTRSPY